MYTLLGVFTEIIIIIIIIIMAVCTKYGDTDFWAALENAYS